MIQSPQIIQVLNGDAVHEAKVSWWREGARWAVDITSQAFEPTAAEAADAFEALCVVREALEQRGWRIGVTGAQADVWPSGMARDQGGGLRAYRMTTDGIAGLVDTFQPVNPTTVVTVAAQRAETDRLYEEIQHKNQS
ncbi:hypothetical protein GCM10022198_24200 [Klugiella xanthotipulae]|uniref:Uncharacterized protein n=1 Tax=Klugiella xanthotipulae TaxID=244735 RepID=A0A543I6F6_9MICO|nr:hypothetical protein [Klugiella xanthotipulae]TQM66131.1 hypothetical protein FB466_0959 [Klugiella xanthotipulae]